MELLHLPYVLFEDVEPVSLGGRPSKLAYSMSFPVAQWVKDLALSLLWLGFDPWPGNVHKMQRKPKN